MYGFYFHPAVSVNAHCEDVGGDGKVTVKSFTQPSTFDEIVLGTQIPCTPGASQVCVCVCVWCGVMEGGGSEGEGGALIGYRNGVEVCVAMLHLLSSSDVVSSQPVNAHCEDVGGDGKVTVESFTQPSTFDEIVLGTQIPCTPGASQALLVLCLSSI